MEVELLVVPDCPHEGPARELALTALADLGLVAQVTTTIIATQADAEARGFVGSPTLLVDGTDPFAQPGALVGLACRVYRTSGGWSGLPSATDLRAALAAQSGPA